MRERGSWPKVGPKVRGKEGREEVGEMTEGRRAEAVGGGVEECKGRIRERERVMDGWRVVKQRGGLSGDG